MFFFIVSATNIVKIDPDYIVPDVPQSAVVVDSTLPFSNISSLDPSSVINLNSNFSGKPQSIILKNVRNSNSNQSRNIAVSRNLSPQVNNISVKSSIKSENYPSQSLSLSSGSEGLSFDGSSSINSSILSTSGNTGTTQNILSQPQNQSSPIPVVVQQAVRNPPKRRGSLQFQLVDDEKRPIAPATSTPLVTRKRLVPIKTITKLAPKQNTSSPSSTTLSTTSSNGKFLVPSAPSQSSSERLLPSSKRIRTSSSLNKSAPASSSPQVPIFKVVRKPPTPSREEPSAALAPMTLSQSLSNLSSR